MSTPQKRFASRALARNRQKREMPKLFSIKQGTLYDVPGSMRKLARNIDGGQYGEVSDALVVLRYKEHPSGRLAVTGFHYGPSSVEIVQSMAYRVGARLMSYDA
jgi:hypothetical protein